MRKSFFLTLLGLALFSPGVLAQGSDPSPNPFSPSPSGLPQGVTREQMWPAPSAEDWKRHCLIQWQRSYEDALAVSKETRQAILVCVNMDGEIASEHYAGIRYRTPEIAKLYAPYVCVMASVYRHTPRDYDEEGRRVLCPRFGSVTCGEHIAIEPFLFENFMEGKRIAPRHIMVELDAKETYDVYYAWDTDTVFNAIREGIAQRKVETRDIVRGDRPMIERAASRHIEDREAIEKAFLQGDREARKALIEAAGANPDASQHEMLRLALNGLDADLAALARAALSKSNDPAAVDAFAEALKGNMEKGEKDALLGALARMSPASPRARTLATVHRGLSAKSNAVDFDRWTKAVDATGPSEANSPDNAALEYRLTNHEKQSIDRPQDGQARLEFAESTLAFALKYRPGETEDGKTAKKYESLRFADAYRAALEAETLGAKGWRVSSAVSIAAYYLGNKDEAFTKAESAVSGVPADARDFTSMAVLAIFAEARQKAIGDAYKQKIEWPNSWLADVNAAYGVIAKHPHGRDFHAASHYDFLRWLGASAQATRVLEEGLTRFADSWLLHDRFRARTLQERGAAGLETLYDAKLKQKGAPASLEAFAGYAGLVAAEFYRRANVETKALAAYERAIAHYERFVSLEPESRASADHFVALAHAGRARIAFERGDEQKALADLLASFERCPQAAASLDGLNISPVDTAKMLLSKLREQKRNDLAAKLDAALAKLDPSMLELPAYERATPGGPSPDARRFRDRPRGI